MLLKNKDIIKRISAILFFLFTTLTIPLPASAFCFNQAARAYNLPPSLVFAIAKVESDLRPDAINFNSNGSYDFGLMQINTCWAPILGPYWDYLADPCYNVMVGAWILRQCVDRYGLSWDAVSCYRTGKPYKRLTPKLKVEVERYFKRIKRALLCYPGD